MKMKHPLLIRGSGLLAATTIRKWMGTLDYKATFYDPAVDPCRVDCHSQKIYIFWHENILFPLYLRGHCNLVMLLSRHNDAEILSRVAYHLGFDFVRGSTYRGAAAALRQLLRKSRHMHLTLTPDGPRGPRRRLAQGPIYLASKLGIPLVVMGFGYDRPWRAPTWDQFAIPRPYSRARAIISPEITIPPRLDREQMEASRLEIERLLNRLTEEAELWAYSGVPAVDQWPMHRQCRPLSVRTHTPAAFLTGALPLAVTPDVPADGLRRAG
jgi:hypothetical protein